MKNDPARSSIEKKRIERPSEGVEEFMSRIPNWPIRFGISLIFLLLLFSLMASAFIRYPNTLKGDIVLTSNHPTQWVQAKRSGQLAWLKVSNRHPVKKGEWLAVIENSASIKDIETLLSQLKQTTELEFIDSNYLAFQWPELTLGEVQEAYNTFLKYNSLFIQFIQQPYYRLKQTSLEDKQKMFHLYYNRQWEQRIALEDQLILANDQLKADSLLQRNGVIAPLEYKKRKSTYLEKLHAFHGARSQLAQTRIQMEDLRQMIIELKLEQKNKLKQHLAQLRGAKESLQSQLNLWEQSYVLKAQINGKLEFQFDLANGVNIPLNVPLMSIVPEEDSQIYAVAFLPSDGASKTKPGQEAHIYLDNYIYQESGQLIGQVKTISQTAILNKKQERVYRVEVELPETWTSVFGQHLDLQQQMGGQVEIITDKMSVFEKLFYKIRKHTHQKL